MHRHSQPNIMEEGGSAYVIVSAAGEGVFALPGWTLWLPDVLTLLVQPGLPAVCRDKGRVIGQWEG